MITGGGGGYAGTVHFYNASLKAFEICRTSKPGLTGLLVLGPLFRHWRELTVVAGIQISQFEPNLTALFAAADLVVAQGGYNSVAELVATRTAAICVPAERKRDDQWKRAEKTASLGCGRFRVVTESDPETLASEMMQALMIASTSSKKDPSNFQEPSGADAAARVLLELCYGSG